MYVRVSRMEINSVPFTVVTDCQPILSILTQDVRNFKIHEEPLIVRLPSYFITPLSHVHFLMKSLEIQKG